MINNPVIVAQGQNLEAASTLETSASGRIPVYDHSVAEVVVTISNRVIITAE